MKRQKEGVTERPDGILCVSSQTHLWPWRGWCGAPSPAGSWRCSGNRLRLTRTRSRCEGSSGSAGRTCAGPGDRRSLWTRRFQGWVWIQRERETARGKRQRVMMTLEQVGSWGFQEVMADSFTYSPSAMHSISSTCPLNTILELEGPDGMRKVGFLSSAGSSTVTHTDSQRKLLPSLLHKSITEWRSRPEPSPSHSQSFLCCTLWYNATSLLQYDGSGMHGH